MHRPAWAAVACNSASWATDAQNCPDSSGVQLCPEGAAESGLDQPYKGEHAVRGRGDCCAPDV